MIALGKGSGNFRFHKELDYLVDYESMVRCNTEIVPDGQIPITPEEYDDLSPEIQDLMWVLYYGKARKMFKKEDKTMFKEALKLTFDNIHQDCIKKCIAVYEGIDNQ